MAHSDGAMPPETQSRKNPENKHADFSRQYKSIENRAPEDSRNDLAKIGESSALAELLRDFNYHQNRQDRILERPGATHVSQRTVPNKTRPCKLRQYFIRMHS